MRTFIVRITIFVLPIIILLASAKPIDGLVFSNNATKLDDKVIIIGDSHTQTGINDKENQKLSNLSQSGEPYFFSYYKLKKILDYSSPSAVILSLSPHNLTFFQDEKTFALNGDIRYKNLYPRYFFSLNKEGRKKLKESTSVSIRGLYSTVLKTNFESIVKGNNAYIGGFRDSKKSNLDSTLVVKKVNIHFYDDSKKVHPISDVQIEYLDKIQVLCKERNISLYVINLPVHKTYKSQIPEASITQFEGVTKNLEAEGIRILDYSSISLPDLSFGDGDHLNSIGAEAITQLVIQDLDL